MKRSSHKRNPLIKERGYARWKKICNIFKTNLDLDFGA